MPGGDAGGCHDEGRHRRERRVGREDCGDRATGWRQPGRHEDTTRRRAVHGLLPARRAHRAARRPARGVSLRPGDNEGRRPGLRAPRFRARRRAIR